MSKPVNVIHVIDRMIMGGAERIVYDLVMNAEKNGLNACVCCLEQIGELGQELLKNGREVICLNSRKGSDLVLFVRLCGILKKYEISVIHVHSCAAMKHAVIAAALARVPVIVQTRHGDELATISLRQRLIYQMSAKRPDAIVTICEQLKQKLIKNRSTGSEQLVVIANGIGSAPESNREGKRKELGLGPDQFVFLNVGNIRPEKGQDVLINAFVNVAKKYPKAVLLVAGDFADEQLAMRIQNTAAAAGSAAQIRFLGKRADVQELLDSADVFVLPSITEGMPISLLEAMAKAKPIIASRVGGIPEMIDDGISGVLVAPGDSASLSNAMIDLAQNKELCQRIGMAALQRTNNEFSLEVMVSKYAELYKQLIAAKLKPVCLIGPFPPPEGGMAHQANKLVERLQAEGVALYAVRTNKEEKGIYRIKGLRTIINFFRFCTELMAKVRRSRKVYIFSCSYAFFFLTTIPSVVIGKLFRKKIIINYHGGLAQSFLSQWGFLAKPVLKAADLIVVPSAYLQKVFEAHGIKSKVINNIIDFNKITFRKRDKINPSMVITRHHNEEYNIDCAIRAFGIIKREIPGASLTLIGDGQKNEYLKKLASQMQLADISFMGRLENENVFDILNRHDIFLNTSKVDNLPVSFLEAFAAGLLVISTPAGGIPYLVKDGWNGFLSQSYQPEDVASQISKALSMQNKTLEMIDNAREYVRQFQWERVKKDIFELLEV